MRRIYNYLIVVVLFLTTSMFSFGQDKNVILIGSDGLSAKVIRENPQLFPNIMQLFKQGSGTLESRSVLPSSSAVNWASHLMGAGPELHGYTEWGSKKPDLPSRVLTENGTFPCVINSVRETYPNDEIGVVYSWEGIGYLYDTIASSYNCFVKTDREVVDKSLEYLKKRPRFAFFYLSEPDHSGHTKGWESEEYKQSCVQIDAYVGELMAGIKENLPNATVIFVSDHGGIKTGHGGKSMDEMQVPFVIVGQDVKNGYTLTNSQMVFDTAPTIAHILGTKKPQVWIGRPVVEAFEKENAVHFGCKRNEVKASEGKDTLQVFEGKTFEIVVDENPTTGYVWSVKHFSRGLESLGSKYVGDKSKKGMVGVGGKRVFLFKSVANGESEIVLENRRPWEEKTATTKVYNVRMIKNK